MRLQIPKSWSKMKASKDDFVLIFESKNGGGKTLVDLLIEDLPLNHKLTKKWIKNFYTKKELKTLMNSNSKFISAQKISLDHNPGGKIYFSEKVKNSGSIIKMRKIKYSTVYNNKLIILGCGTYASKGKNVRKKFNKFYLLFENIAHSIKFAN